MHKLQKWSACSEIRMPAPPSKKHIRLFDLNIKSIQTEFYFLFDNKVVNICRNDSETSELYATKRKTCVSLLSGQYAPFYPLWASLEENQTENCIWENICSII